MVDRVLQVVDRQVRVSVAGGPLVAALAAQAAIPFAERAEAALSEIEAIASGSPDAPSILNKLNKDGGNVGGDAAALRTAIGADLAANVSFTPSGTGSVVRSAESKARDFVTVNDFGAVGDNTTDDTAAINRAVLAVALTGGGQVNFGASTAGYKVLGPVLLPSNVVIDLCGQVLSGMDFNTGTMFQTGWLSGGVITSNLASAAETQIVGYASVRNGQIRDCEKAFHFRNFNFACAIKDVSTLNALQFGVFERSFYMTLDNCSGRGSSDIAIPRFQWTEANNLISLQRVSSTSAFSFHFKGGSTGVSMQSCSSEGGLGTGIKFEDDCLGFVIDGNYFEAIQGAVFDFSDAATCSFSIRNNYINLTDVVFQDGGVLFGTFDASNYIANVGTTDDGFLYRGRMHIDGPTNFVSYELPYVNDASQTVPANWITSKNTRFVQESGSTGFSLTDIRGRTRFHGSGIIPVCRGGDIGAPFPGSVPFCTVAFPTGAAVTISVTTKIVWQPDSLFAAYNLRVVHDGGTSRLAGDVFGDLVKQADAIGKTVVASNDGGFLKLTFGPFDNAAGNREATGSVQIVA